MNMYKEKLHQYNNNNDDDDTFGFQLTGLYFSAIISC